MDVGHRSLYSLSHFLPLSEFPPPFCSSAIQREAKGKEQQRKKEQWTILLGAIKRTWPGLGQPNFISLLYLAEGAQVFTVKVKMPICGVVCSLVVYGISPCRIDAVGQTFLEADDKSSNVEIG